MYLVAILDWYSRYVVSWERDQTLELPFVLSAVQRALGQAVPLICNSEEAKPLYQSAVLPPAAGCQCPNQYGWQRASLGQYIYREVMAHCEV